MKKFLAKFLVIFTILLGLAAGYYFGFDHGWEKSVENTSRSPVKQKEPQSESAEFEANFAIFTDGILRSFANPMYHYLSEEVYIGESPYSVIVKKQAVTWDDFFQTLPFSLTNDCLVTGDGERLCNSSRKRLKFYLNDKSEPSLLELAIKPQDLAVIIYGPEIETQTDALLERGRGLLKK